jgi:predicted ATPase
VLEALEWSPEPGVDLLVGPNGSGKTTVLAALKFLRALFSRGAEDALSYIRGVYLRRRGVPDHVPVHFELRMGDIHWSLDLPVDARGLRSIYGETLRRGDEVVLRAEMFKDEWYYGDTRRTHSDRRCCARVVWDQSEPEWMRPLVDAIKAIRIYDVYRLDLLRQSARDDERRTHLHSSGRNLWSVLSEWKGSPRRHDNQFEWVMRAMRDAFPDIIGDVEFDGITPHGIIFPPGVGDPDAGLPAMLAADGVLTGFLHLTAVAGAAPGAILAFDEMENQLHPFAIRSILSSMRRRAEERGLTILLTTHSPTLMDAYEGHEHRFYVMEPGRSPLPVAVSELHDPVWLTSFSLGQRYDRGDVAAPPRTEE